MFKRFSLYVIIIIIVGVLLCVSSVYAINRVNWHNFHDNFVSQKQNQLNFFIEDVFKDMNAFLLSYASLDQVSEADYEALFGSDNNVTDLYNKAFDTFNVDYLLITDESQENVTEFRGVYYEHLYEIGVIDAVIKDNAIIEDIIYLDNQYYMISAGPALSEDGNSQGIMLALMMFDDEMISNIRNHLGYKIITDVVMTDFDISDREYEIDQQITISTHIGQTDYALEITYNIDNLYDIFYLQRNHIIYIVVIAAGIVCVAILIFLRLLSARLNQINTMVKKISEGDYDIRIETDGGEPYGE